MRPLTRPACGDVANVTEGMLLDELTVLAKPGSMRRMVSRLEAALSLSMSALLVCVLFSWDTAARGAGAAFLLLPYRTPGLLAPSGRVDESVPFGRDAVVHRSAIFDGDRLGGGTG